MALVVCNGGEVLALKAVLNHTAQAENFKLRLFQNNVTPGETDALATYTEATFTGYGEVTLTGSSWTITASPATYAQQTFTSSAGSQNQTIYGYYYARTTGADLWAAERFTDAPYTIVNNGDAIKITPSITAD